MISQKSSHVLIKIIKTSTKVKQISKKNVDSIEVDDCNFETEKKHKIGRINIMRINII